MVWKVIAHFIGKIPFSYILRQAQCASMLGCAIAGNNFQSQNVFYASIFTDVKVEIIFWVEIELSWVWKLIFWWKK
jgi:hypothetical protein